MAPCTSAGSLRSGIELPATCRGKRKRDRTRNHRRDPVKNPRPTSEGKKAWRGPGNVPKWTDPSSRIRESGRSSHANGATGSLARFSCTSIFFRKKIESQGKPYLPNPKPAQLRDSLASDPLLQPLNLSRNPIPFILSSGLYPDRPFG